MILLSVLPFGFDLKLTFMGPTVSITPSPTEREKRFDLLRLFHLFLLQIRTFTHSHHGEETGSNCEQIEGDNYLGIPEGIPLRGLVSVKHSSCGNDARTGGKCDCTASPFFVPCNPEETRTCYTSMKGKFYVFSCQNVCDVDLTSS